MVLYLIAGLMLLGGFALVFKVSMHVFKREKRILWNRHMKYHPPPPRKGYKISE